MPRVNKKNRDAVEAAKDKRNDKMKDAAGSAWDALKDFVSDPKKKKKKPGKVPLNKKKVDKFKSGY